MQSSSGGRHSMIKVTLKEGCNDIELEYDTIESVEELIRVVGSGHEIENLTIFIALEKPKEEEE